MKKFLCLILSCLTLFAVTACNSNNKNDIVTTDESVSTTTVDSETQQFNTLVDKVVSSIEDKKDLTDFKAEVSKTKESIQKKVTEANDEDKSQYDAEQIAVFMLEQAINDYETAKQNNDTDKMNEALNNIETAKKIWSSQIE